MKKELKMKVLFFGILFAVLVGILLFYYRPGNSVLKVGIFYGSNW